MITLLASIAGFITSIIPELIKFLKDRSDKKHELEIFDRQIKYNVESRDRIIEEISYDREVATGNILYSTYNTGINWVDALNGTVRPILAYSFFLMYFWVKFIQYKYLTYNNALYEYLHILWDVDDQAIFAGIISFYFGQRGFKKYKKYKK